ncbi:uncharacterized protein BDZ99DRAFT_496610 [Mytilinidion resinicola]|uniref:MNN4-regulates the mannosylphosphorylation n=1 Tax=Mytilinidion resinicola TaxID=574789 RepID=A0A6A6YT46_9PEZI|nr:uncharacterized protein BDZ99DRAFT_496610 [Mytilinidion resinicola]KAF2812092.1 hypothetical protein BDZ99DRAFT_496610 [Mytilinidion resinicola]
MLRNGASRTLLRSLKSPASFSIRKPQFTASPAQWTSRMCTISSKRPQSLALAQLKPLQAAIFQRSVTNTPWDKIDKKHEEKLAHQEIKPTPETVSATSSTHPILHEIATPDPERDVDMMAGIKGDLKTVKDTFSLSDVPPQAFYIGLAGVLPYLATSLSTVFCAWEITNATEHGTGLLLSHETAEALIHVLEPLQVGYGAVIISFLGAIHWGLEFAGYGGYQGYRRYAIGVVAPAVAWPTILMPVEYALITQFLAFTSLYYVDTRAAYRGWTPPWYNTYRFVLTFIVGASIVVSLIGRGEVADRVQRQHGGTDKIATLRKLTFDEEQEEEKLIQSKKVEEDEAAERESDDESGKDEDKKDGQEGGEEKNEEGEEKDDQKDDANEEKKDS